MADDNHIELIYLQAEFCKCLSDPKRLMMIHELSEGEKSVGDLAERLGLKQSNTSQHIAILRNAGVIIPRREGSTVYYSLVSPKITHACELVRSVIADQLHHSQNLAEII